MSKHDGPPHHASVLVLFSPDKRDSLQGRLWAGIPLVGGVRSLNSAAQVRPVTVRPEIDAFYSKA